MESGLELHDGVAAVWPLAGVDKTLHYRSRGKLAETIAEGWLVRVPIGRRFVLGVVVETGATADVDYSKLKLVSQLCYDEPILTRELLELAEWIRTYYGTSRESVLETMIPATVRRGKSP